MERSAHLEDKMNRYTPAVKRSKAPPGSGTPILSHYEPVLDLGQVSR